MNHSYQRDSWDPSVGCERLQLIEDLKEFSVQKGQEFTLASGQKSNIYIDVKRTMLHGRAMHNLAKLLHSHAQLFGYYIDAVAGVPVGGIHLATLAAMYGAPTNVLLVRKEVKDHGTQKLVEAPHFDVFRLHYSVILFEDVVTTGQSVLQAAKILEEAGYDIGGIVAVVDRRVEKTRTLGNYGFRALVDFEELV